MEGTWGEGEAVARYIPYIHTYTHNTGVRRGVPNSTVGSTHPYHIPRTYIHIPTEKSCMDYVRLCGPWSDGIPLPGIGGERKGSLEGGWWNGKGSAWFAAKRREGKGFRVRYSMYSIVQKGWMGGNGIVVRGVGDEA